MEKCLIVFNFILIFIFSSCGSGIGDTSEELSGGYTYITEGSRRYISSDNIFKDRIYPTVLNYVYNDDFILITQSPSLEGYEALLSFDLETRYSIIETAEKKDSEEFEFYKKAYMADSNLYKTLSAKLNSKYTTKDREISKIIVDSLIRNDPFYKNTFSRDLNYWIISHNEKEETNFLPSSKIYGPFSVNEYLKKRKQLDIPNVLKLPKEDNDTYLE